MYTFCIYFCITLLVRKKNNKRSHLITTYYLVGLRIGKLYLLSIFFFFLTYSIKYYDINLIVHNNMRYIIFLL